jgi:hypothetical protein
MHASLWTYPWDLHDEGVETALRLIRDEGRLGGVSLAANYHTSKCLLPHNPRRAVYFSESGALEFAPRPDYYGRIAPRPSALAREADVWGETARLADRLGLELRAWVIGLHSTALGSAYPECAIENAFGDRYLHSLCPSQPDVRAYLVGLTTDLAGRYPVAALELESVEFMGFRHGFHHEKVGIPLDAWHTFLLDLCFCDACRRAATASGVDVASLRAFVRTSLVAYFDADLPPPAADESLLAATQAALDRDDLRGYLAMRNRAVADLVGALRDGLDRRGLSADLLCFASSPGGWREGSDPTLLRAVADGFILPYADSGREMVAAARRLRLAIGEATPLIAAVDATYPRTAMAEDVADRLQACGDMDVTGVNIYNYGLMRRATLRAIGERLGR